MNPVYSLQPYIISVAATDIVAFAPTTSDRAGRS